MIANAILDKLKSPQSKLSEIEWNYDMETNGKQAEHFISQIGELAYTKLQKLFMSGIFLKRESRKVMREKVKN